MTEEQVRAVIKRHRREDHNRWKALVIVVVALFTVVALLSTVTLALTLDSRSANARQDRGACILVRITEDGANREDVIIRSNANRLTPASLKAHTQSRDELRGIARDLRETVSCPPTKDAS